MAFYLFGILMQNKKMIRTKGLKIFSFLVLSLLFLLLVFGGSGLKELSVGEWGLGLSFLFLLAVPFIKKKFKFPRGFSVYLIFLILLFFNVIQKGGLKYGYYFLILFFSSGVIWVLSYNLQASLKKHFEKIILLAGIIFGIGFIYSTYFIHFTSNEYFSLFLPYTNYHNHIGDFWAICLVVLYYLIRQKQRVLYYFLFILGFSFLAISLSRSAFVALAVGVLYIFSKNQEKGKKLFWAVIVFVGILFLLIGAFKTTLFSRIYFIEAILGFLHNLSGVGMGNFIKISVNSADQVFGVDFVSSFAHNIILEVLTGMGVLGLTFVYFVFDVSYSIFKNSKNVLATAVFFAIFTNFFFDTTYVVSGMFWLWFISLGLAQSQNDPVFAKIARYGKKLFKRAK